MGVEMAKAATRAVVSADRVVELPDPKYWGPALAALKTDKQRRFVWAMLYSPDQGNAARMAGFSDSSNGQACRARGCELMQREDVLAALHEVAWKRLNGFSLKAIDSLERIIDDPEHPKHLVAIGMALDRTGFAAQTEHRVTVEHKVDELQMKALAARFAEQYGVPAAKLLGHDGELIEETVARETYEVDGVSDKSAVDKDL